MANLQIRDLNPELMANVIANAQARRHNSVSEISEQQATKVVGGAAQVGGGLDNPLGPIIAGMTTCGFIDCER